MKMCDVHWGMLRKEIDDIGIGQYVSKDSKDLLDRAAKKSDEDSLENYDPLMAAHNAIFSRVLGGLGMAAMDPEFGCPICRLEDTLDDDGCCKCQNPECEGKKPGVYHKGMFVEWINGPESAAKGMKQYMQARGWIPDPLGIANPKRTQLKVVRDDGGDDTV